MSRRLVRRGVIRVIGRSRGGVGGGVSWLVRPGVVRIVGRGRGGVG